MCHEYYVQATKTWHATRVPDSMKAFQRFFLQFLYLFTSRTDAEADKKNAKFLLRRKLNDAETAILDLSNTSHDNVRRKFGFFMPLYFPLNAVLHPSTAPSLHSHSMKNDKTTFTFTGVSSHVNLEAGRFIGIMEGQVEGTHSPPLWPACSIVTLRFRVLIEGCQYQMDEQNIKSAEIWFTIDDALRFTHSPMVPVKSGTWCVAHSPLFRSAIEAKVKSFREFSDSLFELISVDCVAKW
eukprot:PhF_6_TR39103/c0_g1_i1/m.58518